MAKNTTSKSQESYYARYKSANTWKTNRERRLLKTLKEQPNNEKQITAALNNLKYRRRNPTTSMWGSTARSEARILKEFTGRAPHACFSSNAKIAETARLTLKTKRPDSMVPQGKVDFSLGARLQGAR